MLYTKDKSMRITFRCDEKLTEWLSAISEACNITPSAYVRQTLYQCMNAQKRLADTIEKQIASTVKAADNEHNQHD